MNIYTSELYHRLFLLINEIRVSQLTALLPFSARRHSRTEGLTSRSQSTGCRMLGPERQSFADSGRTVFARCTVPRRPWISSNPWDAWDTRRSKRLRVTVLEWIIRPPARSRDSEYGRRFTRSFFFFFFFHQSNIYFEKMFSNTSVASLFG